MHDSCASNPKRPSKHGQRTKSILLRKTLQLRLRDVPRTTGIVRRSRSGRSRRPPNERGDERGHFCGSCGKHDRGAFRYSPCWQLSTKIYVVVIRMNALAGYWRASGHSGQGLGDRLMILCLKYSDRISHQDPRWRYPDLKTTHCTCAGQVRLLVKRWQAQSQAQAPTSKGKGKSPRAAFDLSGAHSLSTCNIHTLLRVVDSILCPSDSSSF